MKAIKRVSNRSQNIIVSVARALVVTGIAGLMLAHAKETAMSTATATVTIPLSPANLASIEYYSDAQLTQLLGELAATPLTWPDVLPNNGMAGTYWSLAHPNWPPLPATFGTPVWVLRSSSASSSILSSAANSDLSSGSSSGFYLMDDVDFPPSPGYGGGDTNSYDYSGSYQPQVFTTNDLWLQIVGTTNAGAGMTAYLVIHTPWNITSGVYDLFATTNLAPSAWQWVLRCAPGQTNLTVTNLSSPNDFFILGLTNDADGDGLSDAFELLVSHTNPNLPSTDGSGMSDGWEWQYFGSISNNPSADPDGDGLTTLQEYQMRSAGYNPTVWDSNTNGVSDAYEDYSGDGLANFMEPVFGLNFMNNNPSWKNDTDGDGLPDAYESMVGLNPNSAEPAPGLPAYSKNPVP
jgi:hypothetical protein